jgi:hypothetical protein
MLVRDGLGRGGVGKVVFRGLGRLLAGYVLRGVERFGGRLSGRFGGHGVLLR